jgi:xylose isomerase
MHLPRHPVCAALVQTCGRLEGRATTLAEERGVANEFFTEVPGRIGFGGLQSDEALAFKVYQPDRVVRGKRMEEHLRVAVCLWHSFNWPGSDVFGTGTFDRPWLSGADEPMTAARTKVDAAFEFIGKLGAPFFTFHDRDVAPE